MSRLIILGSHEPILVVLGTTEELKAYGKLEILLTYQSGRLIHIEATTAILEAHINGRDTTKYVLLLEK